MTDFHGVDQIRLYFGDDYVINDKLIIHQPTIGDVINIGEEKYFSTLQMLTAIPSDMKAPLWDVGIDWNEFSDIEMFAVMTSQISIDDTRVFFGDLDLSAFHLYKRDDDSLFLMDEPGGVVIDSYIHKKILDFLCRVHSIKKKVERAGNQYTKQILVEDDRRRLEQQKNKTFESQLVPIISTMVNSAGFKYAIDSVRGMKYYQFMDAVMRIQTINNVDHLTNAYYGGNIDTKKFDIKKLDCFADIHAQ